MLPYRCGGYALFFAGCAGIYYFKPAEAFDIQYWAKPRAASELAVEMRMMDKLQASPELQGRLKDVAKKLRLIDEEAYDLVLMRQEYKVCAQCQPPHSCILTCSSQPPYTCTLLAAASPLTAAHP